MGGLPLVFELSFNAQVFEKSPQFRIKHGPTRHLNVDGSSALIGIVGGRCIL